MRALLQVPLPSPTPNLFHHVLSWPKLCSSMPACLLGCDLICHAHGVSELWQVC